MAPDGFVKYYSQPVATTRHDDGAGAFQAMAHKIHNALEWVTEDNKQWIRDDMKALQQRALTLPPLVELVRSEASSMGSGQTEGSEDRSLTKECGFALRRWLHEEV